MGSRKKDLSYYMSLPYKIEILPEEDRSTYTAVIPRLEGCAAFGETVEEALEMLKEAQELWIEVALEEGWEIPEPEEEEEIRTYSGRFNLRIPRSLHRKLAELAKIEDTSLNQLAGSLLAEGVGRLTQKLTTLRTRRHGYGQPSKPFTQQQWPIVTRQITQITEEARPASWTCKPPTDQESPWHLLLNNPLVTIAEQEADNTPVCD